MAEVATNDEPGEDSDFEAESQRCRVISRLDYFRPNKFQSGLSP